MLTYIRKYYYINNYKQPDFQSAELQSIIKMEVIVQILNFYFEIIQKEIIKSWILKSYNSQSWLYTLSNSCNIEKYI